MRRTAYWLTLALIFTVPWEAAVHIGVLGRVSKLLGLVAAAAWGVSVVVRGRLRRPDAFVAAYFLFVVWSGLSLFWSIAPAKSISGFVTYAQVFAMVLILWDLFETERRIEQGLQAYVLGAWVSCVSIIVNFVTAPPTKFPEHQRIKALGFEVDGIALIIALAAPAAWYLATGPTMGRRTTASRVINYAYVPVALFAIILTGTRGAAVASVPTVIFILWTLRNASPTRRWAAWGALVVAVVAVVWLAPREPLERISGSTADIVSGDSLSGRRDIWADGLETFFDNAVAGVGLDSHRTASAFNKEAHNTPLSISIETGLVGFTLFVYVALTVAARAWQRVGWAAWYWRTQLLAVAIGSLSLSLEDSKSVWILAALSVASASASLTSARRDELLPSAPQPGEPRLASAGRPPPL